MRTLLVTGGVTKLRAGHTTEAHLEPHSGDVTHSVALPPEPCDENLVLQTAQWK